VPSAVRVRVPAKVNLHLSVGALRADGYHELVTVFHAVDLTDDILATPSSGLSLDVSGVGADIVPTDWRNLAWRAAELLARTAGVAPDVHLKLHKTIPVAGGMAGGSADAAAALRLLARHSGLEPDLLAIAQRLGADVPGQVAPARYLATGAGERLEPLAPADPYGVLVLPGPEPLSTGAVFERAGAMGLRRSASDLSARLDAVRAALPDVPDELCVNDLEPAALELMPEIGDRMQRARAAGADHVLLSGSGPTVLGLFRDRAAPGTVSTL
jgi:4-diphosphocytidyl-2-C-methyl-D-erythritol kinase